MALYTFKCSGYSIAGIFNTNFASPRASEGSWRIHGKQCHTKLLGFGKPRFGSHCNGQLLKKFCIRKKSSLDRAVLCSFSIQELHFHGGGDSGGNHGGNRGGNGGQDGDDDRISDNNSFISHWCISSLAGLIIYWKFISRDKMLLNRVLICLSLGAYLWQKQLFFAFARTASIECRQSEDLRINRSLTEVTEKDQTEVTEKGETDFITKADISGVVWEVKGGQWRRLLLDYTKDDYVEDGVKRSRDEARTSEAERRKELSSASLVFNKRRAEDIFSSSLAWCRNCVLRLMLPEGYPASVTSDYLDYSLWRMGQGIASQINGVLTTQAATKSCFYAGFAAQRNFAEVIAKGEAQGMVSKSLGIMFGIALSNYTGSSGPLVVASFAVVTGIHMFCNLKSYQAVQLRTLNPYRASLVFSEYIRSGCVPSVKEVNDEEPIFSGVLLFSANLKSCLVMLKGGASPQDMLRAMFQVCHLYWLERHMGVKTRRTINDCKPGGKLAISYDYLEREFENVQQNAVAIGWFPEGLVARPLPFRVHLNYVIP